MVGSHLGNAPRLGVGLIGYGFMGRAHSQAWRTVGHVFDLARLPSLTVICGRDKSKVAPAASQLGFPAWETDWRRVVERDDVDLVDVCTSGASHAEISIAALAAGKHVLCEKPLANSVGEAEAMAAAAAVAAAKGVRAMVGFNFRRLPAVAYARSLVAEGRLGTLRHVRAAYLNSSLIDPATPMAWRLVAEEAGSGALGDLGAHAIDLAQYLAGDRIAGVCALSETFVKERPLPGDAGAAGRRGQVTVDDAVVFIARFASGGLGTFEATRYATGHKEGLRVELNGDRGGLAFDLDTLNELRYFDASVPRPEQGFRRIEVTEQEHPYISAWWQTHALGYEHTFTHEIRDLVEAIERGHDPEPSFADGLAVQQVLDAVARSAAAGATWTDVPYGR